MKLATLGQYRKRVQLVWWPWRFGWPRYHSWAGRGVLSDILWFSLIFYPLEIRVWKVDMPSRK